MIRELRSYQPKPIEEIRSKLKQGLKRIILMGPPGFGKTTVASHIIGKALEKGKRCIFVVDRITLLNQASARLDEEGISHGIYQGDHWRFRPHEAVQVCSIQTLANRNDLIFDLCFIDECHSLHKKHKEMMERYDNLTFIGLTGTPWTEGLGRYFQDIVVGATPQELIDLGYLVEPEVYSGSSPDTKGINIVQGEFEKTAASKATNKPKLVADIVKTWNKIARGLSTLVFAYDIAHSKLICKNFVDAGIRADHIDCYMPAEEKSEKIEKHKSGEITVLCNVGMLDKGYDFPALSCLIDAALNRSLIRHIQRIGRLIRASKEKKGCILLDHAGNTQRIFDLHGVAFITDPLPTKLDNGIKKDKKKKEPKEKVSKKCRGTIVVDGINKFCGYDKPPGAHKCPKCGFAPEIQSNIETEDGELTIINKKSFTMDDKIRWYGELKQYSIEAGYKNGWAYHQFRNKFKIEPEGKIKEAENRTPSMQVLNYIKYQQIKYSKSKKRARK